MGGLVIGSYLFAELSGFLKRTVETWGEKGKVMLPDILHIPRGVFIPGFALLLLGVLYALQVFTVR